MSSVSLRVLTPLICSSDSLLLLLLLSLDPCRCRLSAGPPFKMPLRATLTSSLRLSARGKYHSFNYKNRMTHWHLISTQLSKKWWRHGQKWDEIVKRINNIANFVYAYNPDEKLILSTLWQIKDVSNISSECKLNTTRASNWLVTY